MAAKTLIIKNFLGFNDVRLDLQNSGVSVIEGVNHDSKSAMSNGAGKSTIYDAICWVLFGKTHRKTSGDEVVNNVAKKDCIVVLEFDQYIVCRCRKFKSDFSDDRLGDFSPSGSNSYVFENVNGKYKNIGYDNAKDTQTIIDNLINVSEATFKAITYFGQGNLQSLVGGSDATIKRVFEESFGFVELREMQDKIKPLIKACKDDLQKKENSLEIVEVKINENNSQKEMWASNCKEWDESKKREISEIETELSEYEDIPTFFDPDPEPYDGDIDRLDNEIKSLKDDKEHYTSQVDSAKNELRAKEGFLDKLNIKLKYKQKELLKIKDAIGKKCPTCQQFISASDVEKGMFDLVEEINGIKVERKNAKDKINSATQKVWFHTEQLKSKTDKIDELTEKRDELYKKNRPVVLENQVIMQKSKRKRKLKDDLIRKRGEKNPLHGQAQAFEDKGALLESEKRILEKDVSNLKQRLDNLNDLSYIYGDQGLKAWLLDSITPEINRAIHKYMVELNSDIAVTVSSQKKLKNGDLREKFSIDIINKNGGSKYTLNSSGEQRFIDIAVAFAFNSVCRAASKCPIDVLFLDEPFESLDSVASEKAVNLINNIIINEIDNVFIISHNAAVANLIANTITVIRKNKKVEVRKV